MTSSPQTVVLDIGACNVRVGLRSSPVAPKLQIPCAVGYPKQHKMLSDAALPPCYVGVDLVKYRAVCDVVCPIHESCVASPTDLISVLRQCFELLGVSPVNSRVVLTEPTSAPRRFSADLASLFFQNLDVAELLLLDQSCCGIFGAGLTTGLFVDVGDKESRSCSVVDGIALKETLAVSSIAGAAVSSQLQALLKNNPRTASLHESATQQLKEILCLCRSDNAGVSLHSYTESIDYILPDGTSVTLSDERFDAPEVLFDASAHRHTHSVPHSPRVQDIIIESFSRCDPTVRGLVSSRVVVGGGTSMLPGFANRLRMELRHFSANHSSSKVVPSCTIHESSYYDSTAPINLVWKGAAVFSSLSSADALYITQASIADEGIYQAIEKHRLVID